MPTQRPWDSLVRVGVFLIATGGGFAGILLTCAVSHEVAAGSSMSGSAGMWMLAASAIGGLAVGIFVTVKAPAWSSANAKPRPVVGVEVEVPRVATSIDQGPKGTTYLTMGSRTMVTANNRGWQGYLTLAIFLPVFGFNWTWINHDAHGNHPWAGSGMLIFLIVLSTFVALTVILGSTSICIDRDHIEIVEGFRGCRTWKSIDTHLITRITIRRYQRGKGSSTIVVIENGSGQELARLGANLPWTRLCYIKQVLEEAVINGHTRTSISSIASS